MNEKTILSELRYRLLSLGIITTNDFLSQNSKDSHYYYLDKYNKNLITKMDQQHINEYSSGDGNELIDNSRPAKMKALRSSSALTFNLIGNKNVKVKTAKYGINVGQYNVQFEKKFKTLVGSSKPATLDACLISDDKKSCVLCEMKMFEWLSLQPPIISSSYLIKNKYYDVNSFLVFETIFNKIKQSPNKIRYDSPQMLKHLLGIYNTLHDAKNDPESEFHTIKKVTLLNCVWELENISLLKNYCTEYLTMVQQEHNEYIIFRTSAQPIIELFKNQLNINLELHFVNHKEFINILDKSQTELDYLSRYSI